MNDDMLYCRIKLKTIGPVHIHSGKEISKKDCIYVPQEKKIYILNDVKMFNALKKKNLLNEYEKYLMDPMQKNFSMFINQIGISPAEYKSWAAYSLDMNDIVNVGGSRSKGGGSDNIMEFIKDPYGMPYIPGSSMKGALRTVIQNALCVGNTVVAERTASAISRAEGGRNSRSYLSREEKALAKELFYTLKRDEKNPNSASNDCFAGLRISDSEPIDPSALTLCQKIDITSDGKTKYMPIRRECLKPGTEIVFKLEIDKKMFPYDKEKILNCIDKAYEIYRRTFLSSFRNTDFEPKGNGHFIYIGGGCGFGTKTSIYSLYKSKDSAIKATANILKITANKNHHHERDYPQYHISPRMRKCTKYKNSLYDIGLCSIDIR